MRESRSARHAARMALALALCGCAQRELPSEQNALAQAEYDSAAEESLLIARRSEDTAIARAPRDVATAVPAGFSLKPVRAYTRTNGAGGTAEYDMIAIGDVTGDGRADLVAAPVFDNQVEVFVQRADGTLAPPAIFVYSSQTVYLHDKQLVLADFNRDNVLDVAASAISDSGAQGPVYTLLSNGKGGLSGRVGPTVFDAARSTPQDWVVLDANQDSYLDIVGFENVTDYSSGTECGPYQSTCPRYTIYFGDGRGSFPTSQQFKVGQPYSLTELEAADLNDDGRTDLVLGFELLGQNGGPVRTDTEGKVMVALQGASALNAPTYLHPGYGDVGDHITFADVSGDGIPDSIASLGVIRERMLSNQFDAPYVLPSYRTDNTQSLAVDLDGDRHADVINKQIRPTGGLTDEDVIAVYLQRAGELTSPMFFPLWPYKASYHDGAFAVGDLNGDGCNDLAVASGGILFFDGMNCTHWTPLLPDESGLVLESP